MRRMKAQLGFHATGARTHESRHIARSPETETHKSISVPFPGPPPPLGDLWSWLCTRSRGHMQRTGPTLLYLYSKQAPSC